MGRSLARLRPFLRALAVGQQVIIGPAANSAKCGDWMPQRQLDDDAHVPELHKRGPARPAATGHRRADRRPRDHRPV